MKEFDAKKEVKDIIDFIREYYMYNKLGGAIIGISGGKDVILVKKIKNMLNQ